VRENEREERGSGNHGDLHAPDIVQVGAAP
jgi:hypothetical protein